MKKTKALLTRLDPLGAPGKHEKMVEYGKSLLEWNKKINLTGAINLEELDGKHFSDSIVVGATEVMKKAEFIADVGTGGGFPGIPLAILFPQKRFVLVDSLKKRLEIIERIAKDLQINNVELLHRRAEALGQEPLYRESFDLVISRAVADLTVLTEYCLPLVRLGGTFVAYKGPTPEKELEQSEKAIEILGGGERKIIATRNLFEENLFTLNHTFIFIGKAKKTPIKYPRRPGKPSKSPIIKE